MALEIEDDVFFADISKQIALLIMDDEDSFPMPRQPVVVQELPYLPQTIMPPTYNYEAQFRRECKGTGVFIPKSTIPRRKNKSSRYNTTNNNNNKQPEKSSAVVSSVTNIKNNRIYSSYYDNSSVLKRYL